MGRVIRAQRRSHAIVRMFSTLFGIFLNIFSRIHLRTFGAPVQVPYPPQQGSCTIPTS